MMDIYLKNMEAWQCVLDLQELRPPLMNLANWLERELEKALVIGTSSDEKLQAEKSLAKAVKCMVNARMHLLDACSCAHGGASASE